MQRSYRANNISFHRKLSSSFYKHQKILAGSIDAPVSVMETAGEGGAWGIALLTSYMINKEENETLEDYLDAKVFAGNAGTKMDPDPADVAGFEVFTERYKKGLPIERAAVESLK